MSTTAILQLPYIVAAQAQKHVTHNEAIRMLDAIVQIGVVGRDLTAPPSSPAEGDRYIVAAGATGDWADRDNQLAIYQDGAWAFFLPREGWLAWLTDENALLTWNGADWISATGEPVTLNPTPLVGVNATADATNRLTVSSPGSLFDHEGNGHQQKINKAASGDTASVMFQVGYSGRVEVGLTGDDKLHIKTSPDGATWSEVLVIDPVTKFVQLGSGAVLDLLPLFNLVNETSGVSTLALQQFNDAGVSNFTFLKARGSVASPAGVQNLDRIGGFFAKGWTDSGYSNANTAAFYCQATENFTPTARGMQMIFECAPNGSLTRAPLLGIGGGSKVFPPTDNAISLGNSTYRWSEVWAANGTIQTSDARDKDVMGEVDGALAASAVDAIAPVYFKWKVGGYKIEPHPTETEIDENGLEQPKRITVPVPGQRTHAGFLAQDVKAVMDQNGVDFGVWGLDDVNDPGSRQWLRPDQIIPVLWAALRETRAELKLLQ